MYQHYLYQELHCAQEQFLQGKLLIWCTIFNGKSVSKAALYYVTIRSRLYCLCEVMALEKEMASEL